MTKLLERPISKGINFKSLFIQKAVKIFTNENIEIKITAYTNLE